MTIVGHKFINLTIYFVEGGGGIFLVYLAETSWKIGGGGSGGTPLTFCFLGLGGLTMSSSS